MASKSFFQRPALQRFLVRFFVIFGASQVFLEVADLRGIQSFIANVAGAWASVPVNGIFLDVGSGQLFAVTTFCTGLTSIALMLGLLFGFDALSRAQKVLFALAGALFLFVLNLFRITAIVYVGKVTHNVMLADSLHTLTWFLMSGMVLALWYYGMVRLTKSKNGNALAQKLLNEK